MLILRQVFIYQTKYKIVQEKRVHFQMFLCPFSDKGLIIGSVVKLISPVDRVSAKEVVLNPGTLDSIAGAILFLSFCGVFSLFKRCLKQCPIYHGSQ